MAKILVVDDEDDLRELLVEELNDAGHSTVAFSGGQQALDYLANDKIDLVLSDITMPGMTGYQFFRNVREKYPQHTQTPFIFLTALSDRDSEFKGLRLGADDYITKPIDFDLMLMRVDIHLRRHQSATSATPQPVPSSDDKPVKPDAYRSDPGSAARLKAMLQDSGGRIAASRFVTISLEAVRDHVGDQWSGVCDDILQNAELVLRAHLGPKDILTITPSNDFLVCFADIEDDRISRIRDEIWERLFSITNDECLSSVDAQSHELSFDIDLLDEETIFLEAERAIEGHTEKEIKFRNRQLDQIYSFEKFYALPLLTSKGTPSKIKALSFGSKFEEKIADLSSIGQYDIDFFFDLQKIKFSRIKEIPNFGNAFAQHAMLLPIGFQLLQNAKSREELTTLCKDLAKNLDVILIIEIIDTPDRLEPHKDVLMPLPFGRRFQFIEIGRPQQIDGVALDQIGVAYISMRFSNLEACGAKERAAFVQQLEQQGVKLYVKGIPEGKLFEAQNFKGKLFSMLK